MPTINRPPKKKDNRQKRDEKYKAIAKLYNSIKWVRLRKAYIMQHPICEMCEKKGIIKPTEEVHHIKPIATGNDVIEMMELAYNPDNLMSLCTDCHHKLHQEMQRK